MKTLKLFLPLLLCVLFACGDKDAEDDFSLRGDNHLIFGLFYGECFGSECIRNYKLTDTQLFEDTLDHYNGDAYEFVELSNEKYLLAEGLVDIFPDELLNETETFIGCPDCADGGGLHIEVKQGNTVKAWRIDLNEQETPEYLHTFVEAAYNKVNELSE